MLSISSFFGLFIYCTRACPFSTHRTLLVVSCCSGCRGVRWACVDCLSSIRYIMETTHHTLLSFLYCFFFLPSLSPPSFFTCFFSSSATICHLFRPRPLISTSASPHYPPTYRSYTYIHKYPYKASNFLLTLISSQSVSECNLSPSCSCSLAFHPVCSFRLFVSLISCVYMLVCFSQLRGII